MALVMKINRYFPLGKAYGEAFCNRTRETKKLLDNIGRGVHTFLVAPRRYGKSSLCEHAIIISELPWAKIDFHLAVTEKNLEHLLIKGVNNLLGKSISNVDKLTKIIKSSLKYLVPKINISAGPFALELEVESNSNPAENVAEALLLLDRLLVERNSHAVLLLDEFQEVGQISQGRGIEGAIRHAAQETENLAIIFSGSNPHLLRSMFENDRRPLYKLCKKLSLDRISSEHYKKHLDYASQYSWKQDLSNEIFDMIMNLTERHPYYINALCDEIWSECDSFPTVEQVNDCWKYIVDSEHSDLVKDFLGLSDNQRKVAMYIANYEGKSVHSSEAAITMSIAAGSLTTALSALLEKDFIEKTAKGYRLIVPVYKEILCED